jgi:hypothetical protein
VRPEELVYLFEAERAKTIETPEGGHERHGLGNTAALGSIRGSLLPCCGHPGCGGHLKQYRD